MAVTLPVDELGAGDHACLTFSDEDERLDLIATFVADGLDLGQQVVCYTDADSPVELGDQLAERETAVSAALDTGQMLVHTVDQRWLRDGGFDPDTLLGVLAAQLADAERGGFNGLRFTFDMAWALRPVAGVGRLGAYETAVNDLFTAGRLTSICQYNRNLFDAVTLAVIAEAHPRTIAAATYHHDPVLRICRQYRPRGIRIAGEIDYQVLDTLRTALTEAVRLDHDLYLNLTQLRFMDATIGGEILITAASLPPSRHLTVHCPPLIATTFTILSPEPLAQLRVVIIDE